MIPPDTPSGRAARHARAPVPADAHGIRATHAPSPSSGEVCTAALLAVVGSLRRPESVLVELAGGRRTVTSPRLTAVEARQVAEAVGGRVRPATASPLASLHWLLEPLPAVDVRVGRDRGTARYVRIRPGSLPPDGPPDVSREHPGPGRGAPDGPTAP